VGLAEVSRFPGTYLSVAEVVDQWEVSVRTLRRRLAAGVTGAHQDQNGQWILSAQWVDSEFHRRKKPVAGSTESAITESTSESTIDLTESADGPDKAGTPEAWVGELVAAERRATRAETQLELAQSQIDDLRSELHSARADLDYERALVNRLKDQLRGNS